MVRKHRILILTLLGILLSTTGFGIHYLIESDQDAKKTTVTIAVMVNDGVRDFNTNYYTHWLEEQTGYDITFEYIPKGYETEYIQTMLSFDESAIDAVFLSGKEKILEDDAFNSFCDKGMIYDLSAFITKDSNFSQVMKEYSEYELYDQIKRGDAVYYIPQMDTARKQHNLQVLWINIDWLKTLKLQIPKTTKELATILQAFKEKDPNRNGIQDELPLISCEASYSMQSYNYLLNAFIYNDPLHARLYFKDGKIELAQVQDTFLQGLNFCRDLYENGLISDIGFSYSQKQIMELVNDPEDLVGAFTSKSISDVIYPNCSDILAKFIQVAPLAGPDGEKNAVWVNLEPKIGGYIPANSRHPEEAYKIMDTMLSKEASLIAAFGEEGKDWKYSDSGELSTYGSLAKITTINYLSDSLQNKNFAGTGPLMLDDMYANSVTWNGDCSLVEYIDARAIRTYETYYGKSEAYLGLFPDNAALYETINKTTDDWILRFITGESNSRDKDTWQQYKSTIEKLWESFD